MCVCVCRGEGSGCMLPPENFEIYVKKVPKIDRCLLLNFDKNKRNYYMY